MRLLIQTFTICLALSLCLAAPSQHHEHQDEKVAGAHASADHANGHHENDHAHSGHGNDPHPHFDRCKELVFDAAIENKEGVHYFFKDNHVFKGFHGDGELTNKTFPELDEHLDAHVDAAFHMPLEDSPDHHEHLFFFLDDKVFSYENHKLEDGYPKLISEVFPGIPDHLDAAVECHKPDCPNNTVVFFKGHEIYHYDIDTKEVHEKEFKSMPNCSAAFRYAGHYYCLHGHDFSKFNPNNGEVHGKYPKEAREYFMSCPHYGDKTEEEHIEREQCSHVHLDAITEDDDHDLFAFRGHHYISKVDDKYHAGTIETAFKGLHDDIDAAFAHKNHIHIVKDDKVYIYDISHKQGEPHTLREGYPKTVKEALDIEGHIDAAFICPKDSIVHVIQGDKVYDVDLNVEPHTHSEARTIPFKHVDTAMCNPDGVSIVVDDHYYRYASPTIFATARILPEQHDVAKELLGCDHHVQHHEHQDEKVAGAHASADHANGHHENDHAHSGHGNDPHPHFDRCKELVFDAAIENKEGVHYFFKDNHVFKGFHGDGELTNKTFPELDEHLDAHVDAAFHMPLEDSPDHHEHLFFFLDDKVFSYENHKLEDGYPKLISEVFPGIPDHLDAAVECHKPDCPNNTVVFFKGHEIYHYDIDTKEVHEKEFKSMPNCSAAFRYAGHYYCLHGHDFSKFNPNNGEVHGKYPKEAREYFMSCPHYGDKTEEEHIEREQCSHVHLDAITEDDDHDLFAFRGHHYISKVDDKYHAGTIETAFKGLHDDIDAAFAHKNHIHIVKDDKVYIYDISHKQGEPHTLREGYPKTVKEALDIEGHIDAAFICPNDSIVHVIQGDKVYDVDLNVEPHTHSEARTIPFKHVDTAMCNPDGVSIVVDDHYYRYASPTIFATARILPEQHDVAKELLGCDHHV